MKNLSLKEKAKRYDEALERAKKWFNPEEPDSYTCIVESIFPELYESEDEKIKKAIIGLIKEIKNQPLKRLEDWDKYIAWLEKQGSCQNNVNYNIAENEKKEFIGDGFIRCCTDFQDFREGETYWLEYLGDDDYNVRSDNLLDKTYHITPCQLYTVFKKLTWLEKQSEEKSMKVYRVENEAEQKGLWRKFDGTYQPLFDMLTDGQCKDLPMEDSPIYREGGKRWFASAPSKETLQKWFSKKDLEELVSKGFTISEFEVVGHKKVSDFEYIFTRDNIINRNYLEVSDIYPEQKDFAPKVEPKFKVGDWIVFNGLTLYINEVVKGYYRTISIGGTPNSYDWDIDNAARLWTIEEAKDGDVLVASDDSVFVFARVDGYGCIHYIALANDGVLKINPQLTYAWESVRGVKPATKEQRDKLGKAMLKAGYNWDAEKKELIKL